MKFATGVVVLALGTGFCLAQEGAIPDPESMRHFFEEASRKYDYVVLDSLPVLHVADARILATQGEAVILVSHGAVTPREAVKHAKQHLEQVNGNLIGVVLNNLDFSSVGYDYYHRYYRRGYG